jgi:hypothetical protein
MYAVQPMLKHVLSLLDERDLIYLNGQSGGIEAAYPFSASPTVHKLRFTNRPAVHAYVMCAIDALGVAFLCNEEVAIRSKCHSCGKDVLLEINAAVIARHAPESAVVWVDVPAASPAQTGHAATSLCCKIVFNCGGDCLRQWRSTSHGARGQVLSLGEALWLGREAFSDVLSSE